MLSGLITGSTIASDNLAARGQKIRRSAEQSEVRKPTGTPNPQGRSLTLVAGMLAG